MIEKRRAMMRRRKNPFSKEDSQDGDFTWGEVDGDDPDSLSSFGDNEKSDADKENSTGDNNSKEDANRRGSIDTVFIISVAFFVLTVIVVSLVLNSINVASMRSSAVNSIGMYNRQAEKVHYVSSKKEVRKQVKDAYQKLNEDDPNRARMEAAFNIMQELGQAPFVPVNSKMSDDEAMKTVAYYYILCDVVGEVNPEYDKHLKLYSPCNGMNTMANAMMNRVSSFNSSVNEYPGKIAFGDKSHLPDVTKGKNAKDVKK